MTAKASNTIVVALENAAYRKAILKKVKASGWKEVNWIERIAYMVVCVYDHDIAKACEKAKSFRGVCRAIPNRSRWRRPNTSKSNTGSKGSKKKAAPKRPRKPCKPAR